VGWLPVPEADGLDEELLLEDEFGLVLLLDEFGLVLLDELGLVDELGLLLDAFGFELLDELGLL